ncbi:MAG: AMP-binding protein [Bacteroidetes bacterium]|nr:AMP-binding protein [Bacteroidota bacterium]MBI3483409.1 AMP-binding protein [Bacteroidota bacterium]
MSNISVLNSFLKWEKEKPDLIFLRQPVQGKWHEWSYKSAGQEIRKIASGLQSMGLPNRSNIAILSKNCAHWLMADLAIIMAGYVSVPLYANISDASIRQILEHSESKAIFIGKLDDYEKQKEGIPSSVKKISIDFFGIAEGELVSEWLSNQKPLEKIAEWNPDELLTIMYTSGTTGKPKGVMFNPQAFGHAIKVVMDYLDRVKPLPPHPVLFSYLPLCHIAERHLTEALGCETGASISFVESLDTFARDLASVRPHLFFGVPRIWARFQEKILEKLPPKKLDIYLKIPLLNSFIKKILSKKLGLSRSVINASGAAPMPASLLTWLDQLGIEVHEIYGMTENCALSHGNQEERRHGTVGKLMKSVEAKFSNEGEILTRHKALMMGYYKEPVMTAEVFASDGFLKTGDIGSLDKDGFLTITGRMKDNFKTDKGKYVSPLPMELRLSKNSDIGQVCVVGMGIPQPIALINLSEVGKARSKGEIIKSLSASIAEVNNTVEDYEKLKKAVIMKEDWTITNGLMTPTLKIKRNEVEKIHLPKYPMWYTIEGPVVWE